MTAGPSGPEGVPVIIRGVGEPNPDPIAVAIDLQGQADGIEGILYSKAEMVVANLSWGPQAAGWSRLPLPQSVLGLPNGLYYLLLRATRSGAVSHAVVVKLVWVR
jgi:hypothetical protein